MEEPWTNYQIASPIRTYQTHSYSLVVLLIKEYQIIIIVLLNKTQSFFSLIQMFLEVLHPVFGYTKGSALKNLALVGGRNFVIFILIESEPRMHEKPVVFYLMMIYGALEILRYPYHLLRVYDIEVS